MKTYLSRDSVRKPLATAHTRDALTPSVQKAMSIFIGYAHFIDRDFQSDTKYYLPLETFYLVLNLTGTKNEAWIKESILERLRIHPLEWNVLSRDHKLDWERCSVLSTVGIQTVKSQRYITYQFNQVFAEQLRLCDVWIIYRMANLPGLKLSASLALFQHLGPAFFDSGSDEYVTVDMLDDIRTILGKQGVYKDYKTFRRDVLAPAVKELNKHTEIAVEFVPLRAGRKVNRIEWHVTFNKAFKPQDSIAELPLFDEEKLPSGIPIPEKALKLNRLQPLIAQLMRYKVSRTVAQELATTFGLERCEAQIRSLEAALAASDNSGIKNPSAWLVTAIRQGYEKTVVLEEAEKRKTESERSQRKREEKKLLAEWRAYRKKRGEERLKALCESDREQWRARFIALVENTPMGKPIKGLTSRIDVLQHTLKKMGESSPLILSELDSWLREELLQRPEEISFDGYRAWREREKELHQPR